MTFYTRNQTQQDQLQNTSNAPSQQNNFELNSNLITSPLGNNPIINNGSQSQYNNLSLSARPATMGTLNNGANTNGFFPLRPTPNSQASGPNVSPSLNFASLYSNRARFNASKGFELEDDLEFCPEIQESLFHARHPLSSSSTSTTTNSGSSNFTHHRFNPYTTTTYSPQVSPTLSNNNTSPISKTTPTNRNTASPSGGASNASPRVITPRAKKVLEIVNPITGLRVSSPAPYK